MKPRLIASYGQPNDYPGEQLDRGNNRYLMGKWLIDKKYQVALWESEYCRNNNFIPCTIEVYYTDVQLAKAKEDHERKGKE